MDSQNYQSLKVLIILFAAQIALTAGGLCIAPIAPLVKADLLLTEAQVGLFISFFYIGATITSIPSGSMVDAAGVKKVLVTGQFISGACIIFLALFSNYAVLLVLMLMAGLGYSTINPASTKAIMEWFPHNRRAVAMGLKQTGVTVGGAISAATMPVLGLALGWRAAVLACGLFLMIMAALSYFFYTEKSSPAVRSERAKDTGGYREILGNRGIVILSLLCLAMSASQLSLITYMVTYFYEHINIDIILAGVLLVLAQTGGTIGRLAWGVISDIFLGGRKKLLLVIIALIASAGNFLMSLVSVGTPFILLAVLVTFLGFAVIGWNALFLVLVGQMAGKSLAGTATGLSLAFVFTGVIIGPPAFGAIVDHTSFRVAYQVFAVMLGVVAICFALFRLDERNPDGSGGAVRTIGGSTGK